MWGKNFLTLDKTNFGLYEPTDHTKIKKRIIERMDRRVTREGKPQGTLKEEGLQRKLPVGFILYYNLITPYFVRQHYKAVQLKMTISPQQHGSQKKQVP